MDGLVMGCLSSGWMVRALSVGELGSSKKSTEASPR